jgi:type IV pilus assembly protein PilC
LNEGHSLADSLQKSCILNGTHARMTALAQKTGTLDQTLSQIADELEYTLNNKITSLIAMIEPTLVIILSVVVGTILFSVMLPLLGIMTAL